jgi:hypothetical protein
VGGSGRQGVLRRMVRRLLRWYLWPVTSHISRHNQAVAHVLAENERQLALVRLEHERVDRLLDVHDDDGGRGAGPG